MNFDKVIGLFLASIILLTSCNNFKKVTRETISQGQNLVKRKSNSGKREFQYFVHLQGEMYQITDPEVTTVVGGSFLTAKKADKNTESFYSYGLMQERYKKVKAPYVAHVNQVHYFVKDVNRPLFNGDTLQGFEIDYMDVYYKIVPRWIFGVTIPPVLIGSLALMMVAAIQSMTFSMHLNLFN